MSEEKKPARKRPARTSSTPKATPRSRSQESTPAPPRQEQPRPDLAAMVRSCESEKWTGRPCSRVTTAEPVTVRMADGGQFEGLLCLRCRERFAHQGHEVTGT